MAVEGDRLKVANRNPLLPAAEILQDPTSPHPALRIGGALAVSGSINGVTGPTSAPLVGQAQVATSPTTTANVSAVNAGAWVFDVRAYGAVGDGQYATDGAITSGTKALACTTSTPFTAADVGKAITILGAGASGVTTHVTTIATFVDSGHVTLTANAGATASAALVMWATDDTAAVQAAINAAVIYAAAHAGYAKVFLPPAAARFYGIAGPLVTGGSTLGNGQLTIPIIATTANKVTLEIEGTGTGAATRHWLQTVPAINASCLVSMGAFASASAQITSLNAAGMAAMLSGPTGANAYGTNTQVFNNISVVLRHLSILTTHTANGIGYGAFNFHGMACASVFDVSISTAATVPGSYYSNPNTFATGLVVGAVMPANGNNDSCVIRNLSIQGGYVRGIYATEHVNWNGGVVLYCWSGIAIIGAYGDGGSGVGALHAVSIDQVSVEGNTWIAEVIGLGSGGVGPQFHGILDNEGTPQFHDSTSGTSLAAAVGEIKMTGGGGTIATTFPTAMRIIDETVSPGPAATPSYTLGAAQINAYWRWATVVLQGGTVTAVKVSALMGGASAPAMTTVWPTDLTAPVTIRIPPGGWWEIDGSVKPTTNVWTLD
jgi:hypothetical protein